MADPRWRTGRNTGRTIYCDNQLVGLMDTTERAEFLVSLANKFDQVKGEAYRSLASVQLQQPDKRG